MNTFFYMVMMFCSQLWSTATTDDHDITLGLVPGVIYDPITMVAIGEVDR